MPDSRHRPPRLFRVEGSSAKGWQFIYTGFVLILLCFFIMLTSFASPQQSRMTRFARSFSEAVSVFPQGRSIEAGNGPSGADGFVLKQEDMLARLFADVNQLRAQHELAGVELRLDAHGALMTLSDNLLFASGEAGISAEACGLLDAIGRVIGRTQASVEIGGHTDAQPIHTPAFPSNWELSTSRAVNVLRFLVEKGYVAPDRISAVGFGEYRPLAANDSSVNMARNRRVEFVFRPE